MQAQSHHHHYFEQRAVQERVAADHAQDERAAQPHREMALRYELAAKGELNPGSSDDLPTGGGLPTEFVILP